MFRLGQAAIKPGSTHENKEGLGMLEPFPILFLGLILTSSIGEVNFAGQAAFSMCVRCITGVPLSHFMCDHPSVKMTS